MDKDPKRVASSLEEAKFNFVAPDASNFIPDSGTSKMTKTRKRSERTGTDGSLPSKILKTRAKNTIEISNKFSPLSDLEDDDTSLAESMMSSESTIPATTRRPPPIHIFYCNYTAIKKSILGAVSIHRDTTFKVLMSNLVVRATNITDYIKIVEYLKINKIEYYMYNFSTNKPGKVLIKHLPCDLGKEEISCDLVRMGISVQRVSNFIGRDKKPSTMFIVTVGRDHLDEIYKVTRVLDFSVKIENLKPLKQIIQ